MSDPPEGCGCPDRNDRWGSLTSPRDEEAESTMAGFLGWHCADDASASVSGALVCLRHHAAFRSRVLAGGSEAGAGVVYRENDPPDVFEDAGRNLVVAVLGAVLGRRNGWRRIPARELAEAYASRGLSAVTGHDGAYLVLVWDGQAGELHILNDRAGTLPVQYAKAGDGAAFAPEAKALFHLLPIVPRIDRVGLIGFLNMGHPVGSTTMFEGVRVLPPAHSLTLGLATGRTSTQRTWIQRFDPDPSLTLEAAADHLYEAVIDAHQAPLGREKEETQIALTGGYDSRMVLGALRRVGRLPRLALTWGVAGPVPASDLDIAAGLAATAGVEHHSLSYASDSVAGHAREWCRLSELSSDNMGYFAAGHRFLAECNLGRTDAIYLGDHVIGLSGIPLTVDEAVEVVTRVPARGIVPTLGGLFHEDAQEEARRLWLGAMLEVIGRCSSSAPKDVQDHLYLESYAFRWLFSPGFYKEPMVEARRPLLLGSLLELSARFPVGLRVDKRVQLAMLRKHMPEMMALPKASANCLVDWNYDTRNVNSLRHFLITSTNPDLLARAPWSDWLCPEGMAGFLEAFFRESPLPEGRRPNRLGHLTGWRRAFSRSPLIRRVLGHLQPLVRRALTHQVGGTVSRARFVCRLALVNVLQDCIEAGDFSPGLAREGGMQPSPEGPARQLHDEA